MDLAAEAPSVRFQRASLSTARIANYATIGALREARGESGRGLKWGTAIRFSLHKSLSVCTKTDNDNRWLEGVNELTGGAGGNVF